MISFFLTLVRLLKVIGHGLHDRVFLALAFLYAMIVLSATLFYHSVEGWEWLDSVLFAVATSATVKLTTLMPQTDFGKLFTMVYLLVSVGVFFILVAKISHIMLTTSQRSESDEQNPKP